MHLEHLAERLAALPGEAANAASFAVSSPVLTLDFLIFFPFWHFPLKAGSPEVSLLSFAAFFRAHRHPPLHRSVFSFCTAVFRSQPLGERALGGAHLVFRASISQAAAPLATWGASLLGGRSSCTAVPKWSFCHNLSCFWPCGKSGAGSHCHAAADGERASAFPQGRCACAWEADSPGGSRPASPPPQWQSAFSSCRSAEGEALRSPVGFRSAGSSAYLLHLPAFSVPRSLQKMDSSALEPTLPTQCSVSLGVQRPLQGSNRGAWRNNRDLSLGLFSQPPRGFTLILTSSGST